MNFSLPKCIQVIILPEFTKTIVVIHSIQLPFTSVHRFILWAWNSEQTFWLKAWWDGIAFKRCFDKLP